MYRRSLHGKKKDGEQPRLFLEKAPSPDSQREFDEIVPEFMHRDFYRSKEELEAVEPSGPLKVKRTKAPFVAPPLATPPAPVPAAPPPPAPPPPPPAPVEPLQPVRTSVEPPPGSPPPSPQSQPEAVAPAASGLNYPLIACLLLVVGIFLWREQTRPLVEQAEPLPVPRVVQVQEQEPVQAEVPAEGRYPGISPETTVPGTEVASPEEETEPIPVESQASDPVEVTMPREATAAQRAAAMEKVFETAPAAGYGEDVPLPPAPTGAFPAPPPVTADPPPLPPAPAPPRASSPPAAQPSAPPARPTGEAEQPSLFPSETVAAPLPAAQPRQPAAQPQPSQPAAQPAPAPASQGEHYQIEEPAF